MRTPYADIIQLLLEKTPPSSELAGSPGPVRVEAGAVLADVLAGRRAVLPATLTPDSILSSVPDQRGHHRISYGAMLMHALLRARRLQQDLIPQEAVDMWGRVTAHAFGEISWPAADWPAMQGSTAANMLLNAVILIEAGGDSSHLGRENVSRFIAMQQPAGAWLAATASDNPETYWFDELVILHALATAWAATGDPKIGQAVERNALWHLAETQPDHATVQPWGLPAFILVREANPLADQLLHNAMIREADRNAGLTWLLLADTLYSLRLVENPDWLRTRR